MPALANEAATAEPFMAAEHVEAAAHAGTADFLGNPICVNDIVAFPSRPLAAIGLVVSVLPNSIMIAPLQRAVGVGRWKRKGAKRNLNPHCLIVVSMPPGNTITM